MSNTINVNYMSGMVNRYANTITRKTDGKNMTGIIENAVGKANSPKTKSSSGITLHMNDTSSDKKAITSIGFPNGGSVSVFEADKCSDSQYTVKYWDENGNETEYGINLQNIDSRNASYIEMLALTTNLDITGQTKNAFGDFVSAARGVNGDLDYDSFNIGKRYNFKALVTDFMDAQYTSGNNAGYLSVKRLNDVLEANEGIALSKKGEGVIESTQTRAVSKEDMTMEEYKQYISDKISSFPFHPSKAGESYSINISDAGFEAMKNDPEYEKWVLDDLKTCFAMPVPSWYQAMGGPSTYTIFNYGATKEEFSGQRFPVGVQGNKARFESSAENNFWTRRAESRKQVEAQMQKNTIRKKQMEEELEEKAAKKRYSHQHMMQDYYNEWLANNSMNISGRDMAASAGTSNTTIGAAISSYETSFVTADMI